MAAPSLPGDLAPIDQEQSLVHDVYNDIAPHFSQTRYKPWPIVEKFLMSRPDYSVGIDVGCGNGKYLGVNDKLFIIGTDRSEGLIDCAQGLSANYNIGVADGLNLPHQDGRFDFAISIAVIHHFSTEERRIAAIEHILSKLATGGKALIYCWALEQENSRRGYKEGDDQDVLVPWVLKNKQKKKKKQNTKASDSVETDTNESSTSEAAEEPVTKYRYYHLYRKGELIQNAEATKTCKVVEDGYEKDNWWVVLEKI